MVYHISDENSLQSSNHAPTSQCSNASLLCPAVSHMSPHHHRRWSASLALAAKSPDPFCYRWSLREMHRLGGSNHLQIINPGRFCPCFSRFFFKCCFSMAFSRLYPMFHVFPWLVCPSWVTRKAPPCQVRRPHLPSPVGVVFPRWSTRGVSKWSQKKFFRKKKKHIFS